jgi:hypothetical protein
VYFQVVFKKLFVFKKVTPKKRALSFAQYSFELENKNSSIPGQKL